MASELNKQIQRVLAPVLKPYGFRKAGATWRRPYTDSIGVLNLQGSQWGWSFYVNVGVYFRALGGKAAPLEYDCQMRTRLDSLLPSRDRLLQVLDCEDPIAEAKGFQELAAAVTNYGVAWLDRVSTIAGARDYFRGAPKGSCLITKAAGRLLEAEPGV